MKYSIYDKQGVGTLEGEIFNTRSEVRARLVSFHSADNDYKMLRKMSLIDLCEFGEWAVVPVCELCKTPLDDVGRCECTGEKNDELMQEIGRLVTQGFSSGVLGSYAWDLTIKER